MHLLLQPRVFNRAIGASLVTAVACYPRLVLWQHAPALVWILVSMIFLCAIILWSFVFAWHTPYTGRPVFVFKPESSMVIAATVTGLVMAAVSHFWSDPVLRSQFPEEYPPDLRHWLAVIPFDLTMNLLFVLFAPFDWLMRLAKNRWLATNLTAGLALGLFLYKTHHLGAHLPPLLLMVMLAGRVVSIFLLVTFYWRGGVFLVWWWALLMESRHLLEYF